jgi:hypothetical protein
MAETLSAMLLRHQQPAQAHLGEGRPKLAREAGLVAGVAQLAQVSNGRLVADEVADRIAHHRLFVIEDQRHGRSISCAERLL